MNDSLELFKSCLISVRVNTIPSVTCAKHHYKIRQGGRSEGSIGLLDRS